MSVKIKIILISFISCILIIVLTSSIFNFIISGYIDKLENNNIEDSFEILNSIINKEENNMGKIAIDWAQWDETYNFLADKNSNFIKNNFNNNTIKELNLNFMIFTDTKGDIVYSENYDLPNEKINLLTKKLNEYIRKLGEFKNNSQIYSGIVLIDKKLLIVTAAPITTSNTKLKNNGILIIAKQVDKELLDYINKVTKAQLSFQEIIDSKQTNTFISVNKNNSYIIASKPLEDIIGDCNILSVLSIKRDTNFEKLYYFKVFIIIFSLTVTVVIAMEVFIKDKLILKRLRRLYEFIDDVAITKDTTARVEISGKDEIYEIGNVTNKMLAELDSLYKEILFLSYSDKLTGLRNRAYIEKCFNELDAENNINYAIIMGDLNGLKFTNDTFGHIEGDRLLYTMANIFKRTCSEDDIVARWGGDEFMILIVNKDSSYVTNLIENIKNECLKVDDFTFNLSIALGSVEKSEVKDSSIEVALGLAEERMYRNKLIETRSASNSTISSLLKTLNENHSETEEHTQRIKKLSLKLGKKLGLSQDKLDELELLSILHDIGKIGIPGNILMKKGKLTEEEWEIMKEHTAIGYRIAKAAPRLAHVADEILCHHERFDGTGYTKGLKGEEIPLLSRIINIVDSFDVMTNNRCYKKATTIENAIEELKRCSGTQFDPALVKVFIDLLIEENFI
ncbi:diguanylate cyclase (GGDEF) domain-containing protein [Clostridium cavendishii DSM 21758]|uniref:Diguanylate cyclase (GGDEF) domain-containing protein n=1 Tax=Clostridium cavendishii DSM 21758 TaxID=1121302 RepID=A0A1M6UQZ4_9CLOT|nr:HD domain-containing phosphohydrolase [Clostridium cavendishii]SHK71647.1 diguanylate cyclase (GGDEF) domain-containing protein [Clostridium cavendishii DSM 21758]